MSDVDTGSSDLEPSGTAGDERAGDRRPRTAVGERVEPSSVDPVDPVDRTPARVSVTLAVGFAVAGALVLGARDPLAVAVVGVVVLATGALRGSRHVVAVGALGLLVGVTVGGFAGVSPLRLVVATLFAVLAYDAANYALAMGQQLGRGAATARIELVHASVSATVGTAAAALAYATYRLVDAGRSRLAVAVLLVGVVALVSALR